MRKFISLLVDGYVFDATSVDLYCDRTVKFQENRLAWPEGWPQRFLFIFGLPFLVALSLTIPDCSRPKYEKYYIITFVMSISWISIISSYMVSESVDGQRVRLSRGRNCYASISSVHRTEKGLLWRAPPLGDAWRATPS